MFQFKCSTRFCNFNLLIFTICLFSVFFLRKFTDFYTIFFRDLNSLLFFLFFKKCRTSMFNKFPRKIMHKYSFNVPELFLVKKNSQFKKKSSNFWSNENTIWKSLNKITLKIEVTDLIPIIVHFILFKFILYAINSGVNSTNAN